MACSDANYAVWRPFDHNKVVNVVKPISTKPYLTNTEQVRLPDDLRSLIPAGRSLTATTRNSTFY